MQAAGINNSSYRCPIGESVYKVQSPAIPARMIRYVRLARAHGYGPKIIAACLDRVYPFHIGDTRLHLHGLYATYMPMQLSVRIGICCRWLLGCEIV